jgi:hypothetical protein
LEANLQGWTWQQISCGKQFNWEVCSKHISNTGENNLKFYAQRKYLIIIINT